MARIRKNTKKAQIVAVAQIEGEYLSHDDNMDAHDIAPMLIGEVDCGDVTTTVSDLELDEQAEMLAELDSGGSDRYAGETSITTDARIAEVMASIDQIEETNATSSSTIDHHTQQGSWAGVEKAESEVLSRAVEAEIALLGSDEGPASSLPVDDLEPTFGQLLLAHDDSEVTHCVVEIANELDARSIFEEVKAEEKGKDNPNIQSTIKKARSQLVTKRAARVLLTVKADPAFIMREINSGSKYGVYAIGKLGDIVKGVTDGAITNAINIACMKSLFAFRAAGAKFDMEAAKGAASKQYGLTKVNAAVRRHLISHTVAIGTASTQASSTMQALETLGVVTRSHQGNNPTFTLTTNPIVTKLEEIFEIERVAA